MKIHEKIIHESIKKCQKELAETEAFINARPLNELLELRNEGQKLLDAWKAGQLSGSEMSEKIGVMATKEAELLALAESQNGGFLAALERKSKLMHELDGLVSERGFLERKKQI